jgi:hypothetical protein
MSAPENEFEKAAQQTEQSLVTEFISFLKQNKKFWLLPLIIIMLLLAALLVLSSSAAAPFIYTLF